MGAGDSAVEALDFVFKFVWVYSLKYHPSLNSFFSFLQFGIFRMSYGKQRPTGSVVDVMKLLHIPI